MENDQGSLGVEILARCMLTIVHGIGLILSYLDDLIQP